MFEELLDIPEGAGQFEALEALSSLREDVAAAKACCAQKKEELLHLREQTAELVAAQLAEAGADEDYVQAAKAMWLQAPHSVSQAIGIEVLQGANPYKTSTSDDLVEAERGCNQYKHKPGCPEAEGGKYQNSKPVYIPSPPRDPEQMSDLQVFLLSEMHNNASMEQVDEYNRRFKEEVKRLKEGKDKEPSLLDSYEKEQVRRLRELRQLEKTRWEHYMSKPQEGIPSYLSGEIHRLNREYKEAMEKKSNM